MWTWFNCYLSGRHEFGVWCEPGTVFLRCVHCGRRSSGWSLEAKPEPPPQRSRAGLNAERGRTEPSVRPTAR